MEEFPPTRLVLWWIQQKQRVTVAEVMAYLKDPSEQVPQELTIGELVSDLWCKEIEEEDPLQVFWEQVRYQYLLDTLACLEARNQQEESANYALLIRVIKKHIREYERKPPSTRIDPAVIDLSHQIKCLLEK